MPFISETQARERDQQYPLSEGFVERSTFGETFSASLGLVIDEEMSISTMLHREGWSQRDKAVSDKIASGEINIDQYRMANQRGQKSTAIDYDRLARELDDPDIKTDEQLNQERKDLLAQRRDYANDVIERGSGTAQFLGSMNAYLLDPINILTVGVATPFTALKATSTIGRIALASRNAAVIEGATELGIQAFVFQHKQDIDSPYDAGDALLAIGTAATGGGALAGTAEGLSGYLRRVLNLSKQLPQTKDIKASQEYLERLQTTLKGAPKADNPSDQFSIDLEYLEQLAKRSEEYATPSKAEIDYLEPPVSEATPSSLLGESTSKLSFDSPLNESSDTLLTAIAKMGGLDRQQLIESGFDAADLSFKSRVGFGLFAFRDANANDFGTRKAGRTLDDMAEVLVESGYLDARDPNELLDRLGKELAGEEQFSRFAGDAAIREEIQALEDQFDYEQALFNSPEYKAIDDALEQQAFEEFYTEEINRLRKADTDDSSAIKTAASVEEAGTAVSSETPQRAATAKEKEILDQQGLTEAYDADIRAFNAINEDAAVLIDGELVRASDLLGEYDEQLSGLDAVTRCVYG